MKINTLFTTFYFPFTITVDERIGRRGNMFSLLLQPSSYHLPLTSPIITPPLVPFLLTLWPRNGDLILLGWGTTEIEGTVGLRLLVRKGDLIIVIIIMEVWRGLCFVLNPLPRTTGGRGNTVSHSLLIVSQLSTNTPWRTDYHYLHDLEEDTEGPIRTWAWHTFRSVACGEGELFSSLLVLEEEKEVLY